MRKKKKFLSEFLRSDGAPVGSLAGSWPNLVKKMCRHVDPARPQRILELGPGTGAITQKLLKKSHPDSTIILVEMNPSFVEVLTHRFGKDERLKVITGSALELDHILSDEGDERFDVIISSLPLTLMKENEREMVMDQSRKLLSDDGVFVQYQYSQHEYALYHRVFSDVILDIVILNLPPAFVYSCRD